MENPEIQITLDKIPLGGRLLVRSKKNWRVAVVSRIADESITLSIASPSGYNYRVKRSPDMEIGFDGRIPYLMIEESDTWRENFSVYDLRW